MRAWCISEETEDLVGELEDSAMPTLDATRPSVHFVHQSNAMNVVTIKAKVSNGISSLCCRVECVPKLFSKLRDEWMDEQKGGCKVNRWWMDGWKYRWVDGVIDE